MIGALDATFRRETTGELFGDELDVVDAGVHELELKCAGKAFVEGERGFETGGVGLLGVEFGCGAEEPFRLKSSLLNQ